MFGDGSGVPAGGWDDDGDVIVVGAGSAGAVIARRLADAGVGTLLLEAGGPDTNPSIHDPGATHKLWGCPDDWGYFSVPQRNADDRRIITPRGRVLGGTSSLNGMIYVRGVAADYDGWAQLGNEGWAWDDVLPLFKRSEDFDRGASEYHAVGGRLHVMADYEPDPIHRAIAEAAQQAGLPFNPDHNGERIEGIGFMQFTIKDGRRHSTAEAFLRDVGGLPLTIRTGAHVTRLLFDGTRCTGVEYRSGGALRRARAGEQVVVCAGAIDSPKLLMLSGVGPADELRRHGIDAGVDLPGVGRNFHDHATCSVIFAAGQELPLPSPGLPEMQTHLFWRSRPELATPDLQPINFSLPLYDTWMSGPEQAYTLRAGLIRPTARGSVTLASADPADAPLIDPNYMGTEEDMAAMVAAVRLCREIGRQPALAEWNGGELYPGPDIDDDDEDAVRDYVRRAVSTYHHHAGSCRMGIDEDAVVDPQLCVRGVEGLRVADAAVMPFVTSGNTHAPSVMIGERASDLIAAELGVAVS